MLDKLSLEDFQKFEAAMQRVNEMFCDCDNGDPNLREVVPLHVLAYAGAWSHYEDVEEVDGQVAHDSWNTEASSSEFGV